jgi:uncharacterized membrane protein
VLIRISLAFTFLSVLFGANKKKKKKKIIIIIIIIIIKNQ